MRRIGMALFLVGFLFGALVIVREANTITWSHYAVTVVVSTLGVILMRLGARAGAADATKMTADMNVVNESLADVIERVQALVAEDDPTKVYRVHGRIDDEVMDHVNRFVEVREALIRAYGLDVYARIMDAFASGERALNRTWSASADGYADEVRACLGRAERHFERARALLEEQGTLG